ncbi:TIGR01212 family radical SAM protein [Alkalibacter mobilis]|uniref:TIGR01212 family radical SAM protein n=1 Tax=Alkalibacter mobilis TaxID=2787712 RepID=UPI00189DB947|nr:TIGR01212 family radical SAM protein [Alkalibacter mobilis]MBF7096585.1 TIGR01212 family radical SAM protein [Alkalibacter mobilis]
MTLSRKYYSYSDFLKRRYGEKVYKIPISISGTCPNRDGNLSVGGCTFCGEEGAGHETLSSSIPVLKQFDQNSEYIKRKYNAKKFIPYFQDFTNTYMDAEEFKEKIVQACVTDVVGISISTRPDCIGIEHLQVLKEIKEKHNIDIYIELGLQSVNYKTLKKINRGHTLAEFIDCVRMIKEFEFDICAHMILNLPWDDMEDCIEGAKILSALKVDGVKLHALYLEEKTKMAQQFTAGEFKMISLEEYIERVGKFLAYLSPDIVIHRLIGRAPEENTLFVNWNRSWWVIKDMIDAHLEAESLYQGKYFDYLGGKAVRNLPKTEIK